MKKEKSKDKDAKSKKSKDSKAKKDDDKKSSKSASKSKSKGKEKETSKSKVKESKTPTKKAKGSKAVSEISSIVPTAPPPAYQRHNTQRLYSPQKSIDKLLLNMRGVSLQPVHGLRSSQQPCTWHIMTVAQNIEDDWCLSVEKILSSLGYQI